MTVKELIEELSKHSESLRVVIRGYEDGVDEVNAMKSVMLKLNTKTADYYGQHSVVQNDENYDEFGLFLYKK